MPNLLSNNQVTDLADEIVEDFYLVQKMTTWGTIEEELQKFIETTDYTNTIINRVIQITFHHWKLTDTTPLQFTQQQ